MYFLCFCKIILGREEGFPVESQWFVKRKGLINVYIQMIGDKRKSEWTVDGSDWLILVVKQQR